jgi:CRISPR type I-E-associated protein CasB/Cse2
MTTPIKEVRGRAETLVGDVTTRINKSPGDRAALRRVLGRSPEHPAAHASYGIVARHVPSKADAATERAFYAVAAMIAAQPGKARRHGDDTAEEIPAETAPPQRATPGTEATAVAMRVQDAVSADGQARTKNLGATLAEAVAAGKRKPETTEARLHLLCRQGVDGIHRHLPRLITQLRSDLVPVDWPTLLVDLSRWGRGRDWVAKEWLQDYYRTYHRAMAARKADTRKADTGEAETTESEDQ